MWVMMDGYIRAIEGFYFKSSKFNTQAEITYVRSTFENLLYSLWNRVYKVTCWTPRYHFSIKLRESLLFFPYIGLGTVWRLWISLGSHSALRCSHCESKWDWNWLKDSRFLFPTSVLTAFGYCLVWQLLTLFIILYLFLVINEHSSVFPQLIKWADYGTLSSVTGGLVSSFLLVNSSHLALIILPQGHVAASEDPGGSDSKESVCKAGDLGSITGLARSPGGGHGNPLQYSCLENPHGQRSLVGYSPQGHKESDLTEQLSAKTFLVVKAENWWAGWGAAGVSWGQGCC